MIAVRAARSRIYLYGLLGAAGCAVLGAAPLRPAPEPDRPAPAPPPETTLRRLEMVAMRDGTRLATDVYLPSGTGRYPAIMMRSPYDRAPMAGVGQDGARRGYAIVVQSTRGRYGSEGRNLPFEFDGWADGKTDGIDAVAWVARQPWSDGHIGTFGGSALGITQLLMAGAGTRQLDSQMMLVGGPSLYDDISYRGGELRKAMVEDWLRACQFDPEALKSWTGHPIYDDYWAERDLHGRWNKVTAQAIHIGGWFDIFTHGTISAFEGYQKDGGPGARGRQKLVMGPWTHGTISQDRAGELRFPGGGTPPGGVTDPWKWFGYTLKGEKNGIEHAPAVTYFTMGAEEPGAPGNTWRTADEWPPPGRAPKAFYLHADRTLSTRHEETAGSLRYTYDPANPVPTVGGPNLTLPAGPMQQKAIENRPDVLQFTTAPLEKPLEVTGNVAARLWVRSDAPDTDFVVKLCDVYPDGRSFNICEGIRRAALRNSLRTPQPLERDQDNLVPVDLWSTSMIFNRGHRVRVMVTSSSAPGYAASPNTLPRKPGETQIAHNVIALDGKHACDILLPVAP